MKKLAQKTLETLERLCIFKKIQSTLERKGPMLWDWQCSDVQILTDNRNVKGTRRLPGIVRDCGDSITVKIYQNNAEQRFEDSQS